MPKVNPVNEVSEVEDPDQILSEEQREESFRKSIRSLGLLLKPKPRLNVWQWAEASRYLAKGVSAKSIEGPERYSTRYAPHQRKPQESFTDPAVQVTVLVMASQVGGKTEMGNNLLGYHMDHAPRSSIVMYPQLDAAEKYSEAKFRPMVEATPCLADLIKPARTRDSGNTILKKVFKGGTVYFVGANSPPSLRGASGAVLWGDEIDSNKPTAEGDAVELLWKRGESYPNCVKLLSSTPTLKGASAIWDWFEDSDQQYWFVPCPKCAKYQTLTWAQIVWPKGHPEKAQLICSICAAALSDEQRIEMYLAGEWRPTAPFNGIAGFHLNGIYVPWPHQKGFANRLHQMAEEFLRAQRKGEAAQQVWTNTFLCELWEVATEKIEPTAISGRAEDYTPQSLPDQVVIILCSIDVQGDRIECETVGLGEDDETWGIEFKKFFGDTEQDDVWDDLASHLASTYKRADGVELPITASAIDMRHKSHKVRQFVKGAGLPRIYPVYGAGGHTPILVTTRLNKHYRLRTFAINTKLAKDTIFARLRIKPAEGAPLGGPRFMHYPKGQGYTDEYFLQLTAEVLRRKKERGITIEAYEKIRDRNEALDIRVYFLATIDILKPNITAIAKRLKPAKPPNPADLGKWGPIEETSPETETKPAPNPKPKPPPFRPPRRPGGGFVGGWRK